MDFKTFFNYWLYKFLELYKNHGKKFLLYLGRWQLSTPILFVVLYLIGDGWIGCILANLIGGGIFFFVDKWIFSRKY